MSTLNIIEGSKTAGVFRMHSKLRDYQLKITYMYILLSNHQPKIYSRYAHIKKEKGLQTLKMVTTSSGEEEVKKKETPKNYRNKKMSKMVVSIELIISLNFINNYLIII